MEQVRAWVAGEGYRAYSLEDLLRICEGAIFSNRVGREEAT